MKSECLRSLQQWPGKYIHGDGYRKLVYLLLSYLRAICSFGKYIANKYKRLFERIIAKNTSRSLSFVYSGLVLRRDGRFSFEVDLALYFYMLFVRLLSASKCGSIFKHSDHAVVTRPC